MPSWLSLERTFSARGRRKKDSAAASTKSSSPTTKTSSMQSQRSRPQEPPLRSPPISDKLRRAYNGSERPPAGHKRSETAPTFSTKEKQSLDLDTSAKSFTVGNVGTGGLLYLKPTRMALPNFAYMPATPPATSDGTSSPDSYQPLLRGSDMSGAWTPRLEIERNAAMVGIPVPSLDLGNEHPRRRSHSCTSIRERTISVTYDANALQLPAPGESTPRQRRASSTADLPPRNLKDIVIPHYRSTGVPSSVLSRTEYEKLFPVPPSKGVNSFYSHLSGGGAVRQNSSLYGGSRASRTPFSSARPSTVRGIAPALFDALECNLNDPALVRYHPTTGRILAATPARLIAQITSPQFLDYELLADFFLTFRCFMTCSDVLDHLIARLHWAFVGGNDAGRVARVRTFVALRHWILNYFVDDFMMDAPFRQNFCDRVNELATLLRQRPDGGGGDINIVGELKKCWRRTCALYWPITDEHESPPDVDIVPGGQSRPIPSESDLSLPLTIRPASGRRSVFEMTQVALPDRPDPWGGNHNVSQNANVPGQRSNRTTRTASIPASPASEQSLEVLSCSVPFLQHLRPTARAREKQSPKHAPPKTLVTQGRTDIQQRPRHNHKRSGSFNDALRDHRTPLSSPRPDNVELKDLHSFAITGGLIRGILLQPSVAKVDNNVPVTPGPPGPDVTDGRLVDHENYFSHSQSTIGVRKFVGEVRRALSSRKAGSESRSRSSGSERRGSARRREDNRKTRPDYQQLPGPSRLDILGLRIEETYHTALDNFNKQRPESALKCVKEKPLMEKSWEHITQDKFAQDIEYYSEKPLPTPPGKESPQAEVSVEQEPEARRSANVRISEMMDFGRLHSHVTTGSRSIVIVDATGGPQIPFMSGGLPSFSSASTDMMPIPLFRDGQDRPPVPPIPRSITSSSITTAKRRLTRARSQDSALRTSDQRMHDLLTDPNAWELIGRNSRKNSRAVSFNPRRSSSAVHSTAIHMPALPHQLRRQPGGDLKAANHVHELVANLQRRHSEASLSTASRSYTVSLVYSVGEGPAGGVMLPDSRSLKQRSVSLIQALSSQPILRASFVAEAERLKSMPDDVGSSGGIEDALLKLEGKIPSPSVSTFSAKRLEKGRNSNEHEAAPEEKKRAQSVSETVEGQDNTNPPMQGESSRTNTDSGPLLSPPPKIRELRSGELKMTYYEPATPSPGQHSGDSVPLTETQGASIFQASESGLNSASSQTDYPIQRMALTPDAIDGTEEALLIPIVTKETRMTQYPIPDPYPRTGAPSLNSDLAERYPNSMLDAASSARYPSFQPGPWGDDVQHSFLLDDNETLSDISTQLSSWHDDEAGVRSFFFDDSGKEDQTGRLSPHDVQVPATPTSTVEAALQTASDRAQLLTRYTPRNSKRPLKGMIGQPRLVPQTANQPFPRRPYQGPKTNEEPPLSSYPAHLPFVLAFESEVIAEQLTIIEKDALDEVDWKDLVSLNWLQNPPDIRNWVDFVNREHTNGVDVIIARFNLVVKWCISEIVLTDVPSERARAITKYIHIASHCHQLRNYSSMYQIILALLSADLARLHGTWSLVALREKQMLEHLEKLCRPFRNFHTLRQEMESAMPGNGIIPFIGLYTHDLMFNALKSSRIDPPKSKTESLINFERYQTAAAIVKNLLRLIEASSRYTFHPEPEALSRCLWIAALDDQEITARSRALEAT